MCQRHIPAGGGAAALAGTRRVALGALGGGVGWGGVGVGDTGGTDVCVAKIERHVNVLVSFFAFFVSFFGFFLVSYFFALPCSSFLPLPRCERCELVYYTSKKEDEIETDTVSLFAHFYYVLPPCVAHPRAVSVFFVELFPLNVQTWFSHEGPMLDRFQIFYLFHPGWTPVEQPHTINYPNKL